MNETTVVYTSRSTVLTLLLEVIEQTLSPSERCFLMAYCGYPDEEPRSLRALASEFSLHNATHAKNALQRVIRKVREAIPSSSLAPHLYGFSAFLEKEGKILC